MILVADVGNTTTVLALCAPAAEADAPGRPSPTGIAILARHRLPTPHDTVPDDFTAACRAWRQDHAADAAVVCSVVPPVTDALRRLWPGAIVVDERVPLPFDLAVTAPEAVGADRYANAAAAVGAGWSTALVVDCGTATTFDVLRDGVFVGGLIAPGIALAARALGERAARLHPVDPDPCPLVPAADTESAMRAGGFHVGAQGVVAVARRLREQLGDCPVVVTGGLGGLLRSPHLDPRAGDDWLLDPEWAVRGAAVIGLRARNGG